MSEHTILGTVRVLEQVDSPQLDNQRDILVYLPSEYDQSATRYPVIYVHDGQNLFDQATSIDGEWQVDEAMEALSQAGYPAIVVGIPSLDTHSRVDEYGPFPDPAHGGGKGEQYLAFIVETLKLQIAFTLPGRAEDPSWELVLDTARMDTAMPAYHPGLTYSLQGRSLVLLCQPFPHHSQEE